MTAEPAEPASLIIAEPERLRPPRGYALVRVEPEEQDTFWRPAYGGTTHWGMIAAVGLDVTEVLVGDRVLVEGQSGHPSMQLPLICGETGRLLEIVPCRWPDPVQTQDENYQRRLVRMEALKRILGQRHGQQSRWPEQARGEIRLLQQDLDRMRAAREGHSRSRLWIPTLDLARGQGVLAVEGRA